VTLEIERYQRTEYRLTLPEKNGKKARFLILTCYGADGDPTIEEVQAMQDALDNLNSHRKPK
jgi:hypothetical protein